MTLAYRLRNGNADHGGVSTDEALNPTLAENFRKLAAGRSIEVLRSEMAAAGIAIGGGTLHRCSHGDMGVRGRTLEKVATFFGVTADQLLQPKLGADMDAEFVDVSRLSVSVSAGRGTVAHLEETVGSLKFMAAFLRSVGASRAHARIVDVSGHSMEPTIPDGAVLLINTAQREPRDRQIYALRIDGELYVKRLVRTGEAWIARSDNEDRSEYPDIPLGSSVHLIGRAVWMGTKL